VNLRRKTVVTVISKIGDRRPKADACLVVIYGQAMGQKYVLKPGEIVIGRSSQSQIQIDHESVSRRHARLIHTEAGISLSDLGSTNGTYVNDEPIQEVALSNGDLVKVGRSILKYLSTDNIEGAYHEEIYRLTTVDGLTRCYNARFLREAMARETSRATGMGALSRWSSSTSTTSSRSTTTSATWPATPCLPNSANASADASDEKTSSRARAGASSPCWFQRLANKAPSTSATACCG
jgi:hypothetical protein